MYENIYFDTINIKKKHMKAQGRIFLEVLVNASNNEQVHESVTSMKKWQTDPPTTDMGVHIGKLHFQ